MTIRYYSTKIILLTSIWLGLLLLPNNSLRMYAQQAATARIQTTGTNVASYPNGQIPQYEKFEISFQVDTAAPNLQWPYDPAPPPGIAPGDGVTVNAIFTPDNWQTRFIQPAFYYQAFQDESKDGQRWLYPTSDFVWKVRFTPNQAGSWQYKLMVQD
ncbi:MAG: DUF5060 domain-containing protein, partial [Chloroflexi bacterium]|nr:DUF5060 domain-containing protein [Chloroflexota bacterium]